METIRGQSMDTSLRNEAQGGAETERIDILVALEHVRLVRSALADHGVTEREADSDVSPELGLARIAGDFRRGATPAPAERDPVNADDALLLRLRTYFEKTYARWSPTMGKNRIVGQVTGGGSISHGGGPSPKPADPGGRREGRAGLGITVGVLDTSLYPHPALAGGYVGVAHGEECGSSEVPDVLDSPAVPEGGSRPYAAGHATFVTGLVLSVAPAATVRVHSVLDANGQASSWDVARAIVDIGRTGAQILNLSFVCYTDDGKPPLGLATAVDRLDPDVLVIACAGNHGDPKVGLPEDEHRKPSWPAALDDVVAVGSATRGAGTGSRDYALSDFTPPDAAWIDVVTRGEDVTSTYFAGTGFGTETSGETTRAYFHGWATWSGTSFAAALLTGRVAAVAAELKIPPRAAYWELMESATISPRSSGRPRIPPFLDL